LKSTHFANVTGLPQRDHYSVAGDLALLAAAIIRDYPDYFLYYSIRQFEYNGIAQFNRNLLLGRDPNVDGMKTGYTESAGYCFVVTARRGQRRLIAVLLDASSESARAADGQKLLNFGFERFELFRLYEKGQVVDSLPVWKGSDDVLKAGVDKDLIVTLPKGTRDKLSAKMESMQPLLAPVGEGQEVAKLHLRLGDQPFADYPIVALERVGIANLFGRAWDSLRLLFK
jgi:D-alanyl-D-alanine carboxypeptidase (penicillin-binding protein 5/6)